MNRRVAVPLWLGLSVMLAGCPGGNLRPAEVLFVNGLDQYIVDGVVLWDPDAGAALSENLLSADVFTLQAQRFRLPTNVPDNAELSLHLHQSRNENIGFTITGPFLDEVTPGEEVFFIVGNSSGVTYAGETTVTGP